MAEYRRGKQQGQIKKTAAGTAEVFAPQSAAAGVTATAAALRGMESFKEEGTVKLTSCSACLQTMSLARFVPQLQNCKYRVEGAKGGGL